MVSFEKKGALSPVKEVRRSSETVRNKSVVNLSATLNKLDPQDIKAKLGKANNLSDLKERLRKVHKFKVPDHNKRTAAIPKLSEDPISISISVPVTSPKKILPGSPAKIQGN